MFTRSTSRASLRVSWYDQLLLCSVSGRHPVPGYAKPKNYPIQKLPEIQKKIAGRRPKAYSRVIQEAGRKPEAYSRANIKAGQNQEAFPMVKKEARRRFLHT